MIYTRFDYLLKSYLRHTLFSPTQVARELGITPREFKLLIGYPLRLPELSTVENAIKKLKLPPQMVWESYFNSVFEVNHQDVQVCLVNYQEYEDLIRHNKQKRKTGNIPSEEVFLELLPKDKTLNGVSLKDSFKVRAWQGGIYKNQAQYLSKELKLKTELVSKVLKNKLPTVSELNSLLKVGNWAEKKMILHSFIASVVEIKKLNYKVVAKNLSEEERLLDRIYVPQKKGKKNGNKTKV